MKNRFRPIYIKNSNVQTVRRDLRNRQEYTPEPMEVPLREDETSHEDGLIDREGVMSDGEGEGVMDDNDDSIVDGYGDHDDTEGHDSRTEESEEPSNGYSDVEDSQGENPYR
jgi:hypothetical protein